jgi:hypothetical protein
VFVEVVVIHNRDLSRIVVNELDSAQNGVKGSEASPCFSEAERQTGQSPEGALEEPVEVCVLCKLIVADFYRWNNSKPVANLVIETNPPPNGG